MTLLVEPWPLLLWVKSRKSNNWNAKA